uniref:restriction endonuclease subunit S n=1 Tax=Anabaena sp. CCY 0017 TaxID=3103866 RepID=UPI0039C73250
FQNRLVCSLKRLCLQFATPSTRDIDNFIENGIPWLTPADLSNYKFTYIGRGARDISEKGLRNSSARVLPKGAVLFTSRAPIGYCVIASNEITTNQGFKSFVISGNISPEFIRFYLLISKYYAESLASGSTFKELSAKRVATLEIPLPPLNEQRRIVAKIEALKARSQRVKEALEEIPQLLDQFRQSVLAAAFRGDLTADWREQNPDVEAASVLLERIRAERRRRWEEAELEKMKASGKTPKDDKWKEKYKEPEIVEEDILPDLPDNWCWLPLELVADAIDPQPSHRTPPEVPHGIPYVGIGDIRHDGTIDFDGARKVSLEVLKEHKQRYRLENGNFIFGKIGTLGKPVKLPLTCDYTLSANVILLQTRSLFLISDWLFYFMKSPFVENLLTQDSRATSQAAFGIKRIRLMPVPLPPIQEQKQILLKLEHYLSIANQIKSLKVMCLKETDELNQSILAKAFRGELVPQDPNDEPASVLLERIRAERAKLQTKTAKKSPTKTRARRTKKTQPQEETVQLELGLE